MNKYLKIGFLSLIALTMFAASFSAEASLRFFDSSDENLGAYTKMKCDSGLSCSIVSDQVVISSSGGTNEYLEYSSDTTLAVGQCGATIANADQSAISLSLPEASSVQGCRYTFVVASGSYSLTIGPALDDQIAILTDGEENRIASDEQGNTISIEAVTASLWFVITSYGGDFEDIGV